MVWIHAVTEGQKTTRMNPVSDEKLGLLADHIRLSEGQRVLDIGAGRCGPTITYARERGCTVTAVEPYADFLDDGRAFVDDAGLTDRFTFVEAKATDAQFEPDSFDVAMCLGATFAYGGLDGTLEALTPLVVRGGHVVCGEPFRDVAGGTGPHDLTLREIIDRFEERGLAVISVIRSSDDDWNEYNSVRVRNLLDWVEQHPDHPDVEEVTRWRYDHAVDIATRDMGWAIVSGRKM
jgi:precorrin-6B methylase 2